MRLIGCALLSLGLAASLASGRDFLTTDEADQVRLAQEPNERLKLYLSFARQRVDLLAHLLSREQAGRTSLIHETLEDYTKIVETIDVVADDALSRGVKIDEGMSAVAGAEKDFLAALEKIREGKPRDLERYEFALETAIETTSDSLEIALEDLRERGAAVAERQKEERKELEKLMTPEMARERGDDTAARKKKEEEQKRKAPSLYRKGEQKPDERK
jgi:hypothetical protein